MGMGNHDHGVKCCEQMSNEDIDKLFKTLDQNDDGAISLEDLKEALNLMQIPQIPLHAEKFLGKYDLDQSGVITYDEFKSFVKVREKDMMTTFDRFDINRDGIISAPEVKEVFYQMGVKISLNEAQNLIDRMDLNNSKTVSWQEWKAYFILHPFAPDQMSDVLHYWRHSTLLDSFGEGGVVPDDFSDHEKVTGSMLISLLAGGIAGGVSRTCTAPLDRLKIFMQVYGSGKRNKLVDSCRNLLKEGGIKGMWRGNFLNVLKIAPETAAKFTTYEAMKRLVRDSRADANKENSEKLSIFDRFFCGSVAGVVSQTIVYPGEVVKTRMALGRTGEYNGIFDCGKKIWRNEGIRSFSRGYLPNVCGVIPYAGIDLAVYESLKNIYMQRFSPEGDDPGILALLGCGCVSSISGQLVSYPFALVRTRMQSKATLGGEKDTVRGLVKTIIQKDGIFGLYRGLVANFLKVVPAVSISYVVYERSRKVIANVSGWQT